MMSDASHTASGAMARRLIVQFPPLLERGMLMISNCTPRQRGSRSRAWATRRLISSRVAGVFANVVSKSISGPLERRLAACLAKKLAAALDGILGSLG